jgi:hypothetical protein
LRTAIITLTTIILSTLVGCQQAAVQKKPSREKCLLTVDFQQGVPLKYKFVSSRDIQVQWDTTESAATSNKTATNKYFESMEMVVAYTPIEVNPYGLSTIKAACNSIKVTRSRGRTTRTAPKDAVEHLRGKTFTFTVGPTGKVEDYSQLDTLIKEIGKKAFRADTSKGRIKEPDMIGDFVASQWFLWDSISSVEDRDGISVGQTWKSKLSVPTPMVMREARGITYKLDEIRESEKGRLAVIRSSYELAESAPSSWPIPYSGTFQTSGTFGFLRGYKALKLTGEGEELFNIDTGQIEKRNQQYQMELQASIPLGISANPAITIDQKLTMQLIE